MLTFSVLLTADFDLTGQLVWPGAMLLNDYLSKNTDLLKGCSVLELGSGVGKYSTTNARHFFRLRYYTS